MSCQRDKDKKQPWSLQWLTEDKKNIQSSNHYSGMLLFCPSSSCTIICCIDWFTSLCKNLLNLLEFLVEAFRCHVHHFQLSSTGTVKHWKLCTWHQKASARNSSKLNKFLHSEVNQSIQHIIVQDEDGQNNNIPE